MKPFHQTPEVRRQLERRDTAQERILQDFLAQIDALMLGVGDAAVDQAISSNGQATLVVPDLTVLFQRFYASVISKGLEIAEEEDPSPRLRRLARAPKGNLPKNMKEIDDLFRDRKAMKRVFKRSQTLSRALRRAYLQRLKGRFAEIMPAILDGRIDPSDAKKYIRDAWGASRSRAQTIFRTESTKYFAEAQVSYYAKSSQIIGFLYDTIRDVSRTEICRSRHGLVYRPGTALLKKNTPPLHFNCRSHLVPLADTPGNRKMISDPARDPEKVKVAPLPRGWRK